MDGIRAWSTAVCLAALGCAAVRLLAPKAGAGKLFHLITATFFLCCLISPLLDYRLLADWEVEDLPPAVVDEVLEETVTEQLHRQVKDTVTALAEEALAARRVTAKKIEVTTDSLESGGIYIQQITITVDKQSMPTALVVGEVLETQLEAPVAVQAAS